MLSIFGGFSVVMERLVNELSSLLKMLDHETVSPATADKMASIRNILDSLQLSGTTVLFIFLHNIHCFVLVFPPACACVFTVSKASVNACIAQKKNIQIFNRAVDYFSQTQFSCYFTESELGPPHISKLQAALNFKLLWV